MLHLRIEIQFGATISVGKWLLRYFAHLSDERMLYRFLIVVRSAWAGLSTFILLPSEEFNDGYLDPKTEIPSLTAGSIRMTAGFCVSSPKDPRYARVIKHRDHFGSFLHRASAAMHNEGVAAGDEQIDAVLAIIRSIDTFLLEYSLTRNDYATSKKTYEITRDLVLTNAKQKLFPRNIWVKRAQASLPFVLVMRASLLKYYY